MPQLAWTVGRPSVSTPRLPMLIYNVPVGPPTYVRFLGDPCCLSIHGIKGGSHPCVAPALVCPYCERHQERIPAGYAPAQRWGIDNNGKQNWLSIVCALTDHALELVRGHDLRGEVWKLHRADNRRNAKLLAEYHERQLVALPPEFEVTPIVENCWRNYLATFPAPGQQQLPLAAPNVQVAGQVREEVDMEFGDAGSLQARPRVQPEGGAL